jgi:hypothetical protein
MRHWYINQAATHFCSQKMFFLGESLEKYVLPPPPTPAADRTFVVLLVFVNAASGEPKEDVCRAVGFLNAASEASLKKMFATLLVS